jgi:hypothetical protein
MTAEPRRCETTYAEYLELSRQQAQRDRDRFEGRGPQQQGERWERDAMGNWRLVPTLDRETSEVMEAVKHYNFWRQVLEANL